MGMVAIVGPSSDGAIDINYNGLIPLFFNLHLHNMCRLSLSPLSPLLLAVLETRPNSRLSPDHDVYAGF